MSLDTIVSMKQINFVQYFQHKLHHKVLNNK